MSTSPQNVEPSSSWLADLAHVSDVLPPQLVPQAVAGLPIENSSRAATEAGCCDQEVVDRAVRLRKALLVGASIWPLYASLDGFVSTYLGPSDFSWLLTLRITGWVIILGACALLRVRSRLSLAALRAIDLAAYGSCSALVSAMCLGYGGPGSPYAAGIILVMACRAPFINERWRDGLWHYGLCVSSHPVTMGLAALHSEEVASQLIEGSGWASALQYQVMITTGAVMFVVGGHAVWALRRQLYEARKVGPYRLVRRIGGGAMGEVWAALHPALKLEVALKLLKPERQSLQGQQRFEREACSTARLGHPNTVRIFDFGVTGDGLWYYAMELLRGEDLDALVTHQGPLSPEHAARLVAQASSALHEAHSSGIIHRDVKPANLFALSCNAPHDFVKVLDFGLARIRGSAESTRADCGSVAGTPAFVSPEVIRHGVADARSDIYSLGATLHFLLSGRVPFPERSLGAMLRAHAQAPLRPMALPRQDRLCTALEAILTRCLNKDPDLRFQHANDLAIALETALRESDQAVHSPAVSC